MTLRDLAPYFELYKNLKDNGQETILNEALEKKEKEYTGKEITLAAIVSEINTEKNELILTYKPDENPEGLPSLKRLIPLHFFIFAFSDNLTDYIKRYNIEVNDLVEVTGNISTLHRHSVLRLTISSVNVMEKKHGILKISDKKGCFIATAVYGSASSSEVRQFYQFRDEYLSKSIPGRLFIRFYYLLSPGLAKWIDHKPRVKSLVKRYILEPIRKKVG